MDYKEIAERYGLTLLPLKQESVAFMELAPADSVKARRGAEVIRQLRDREGFGHLVFLTAVDYPEKEQFRLSYMLHNYRESRDICLLIPLNRENPVMESIHTLWAQGATYQRELKEMFGIEFPGSPELDRPFILEGWQDIPPMRRDFDTKEYSEKTYFPRPGRFTKDPERVMREALYPDGERR